jgi:imidazolonepropionase-like amidohydrolase
MQRPHRLILDNCRVIDVIAGKLSDATALSIENGVISARGVDRAEPDAQRLDLGGAYVLPGLIDCHVHALAGTGDLAALRSWSSHYTGIQAARSLEAMLRRGFTRVRDVGGADWGLALAAEQGLYNGPTLHYGGLALSQTGGHGDMRSRGEDCGCSSVAGISRVADGVDAVRAAVRDERRKGASHVKLMLSGGVASPLDVLENDQYSDAEIAAAVEEAARGGIYVAGHAYTPQSIARGARLGVRSIEHGNYLDAASLDALVAAEAFLVPTLATYSVLAGEGAAAGVPSDSLDKLGDLFDAGLEALALARRGGAKIAFGTDLLGAMQTHQADEFTLRGAVESPADTIRSATTDAAELLGVADSVGRIEEGYSADLIVVDADPLSDPQVLAAPEEHLRLVVIDGQVRFSRPA